MITMLSCRKKSPTIQKSSCTFLNLKTKLNGEKKTGSKLQSKIKKVSADDNDIKYALFIVRHFRHVIKQTINYKIGSNTRPLYSCINLYYFIYIYKVTGNCLDTLTYTLKIEEKKRNTEETWKYY